MKRLFALVFAICLVLCGCSADPSETVPPTKEPTVATEPSTEATVETTVATEPVVLYRNPLNGTLLEAPYEGRVVAVVINNLRDALPHRGVAAADFLYEVETEGGITRCLAVYSDVSTAQAVGPVRSARTYFNNLAVSYDAPIVHCGGSVRGRNAYVDKDGDKVSPWIHLDQMYNGGYFYRDQDRLNSGYSMEHTLFTTGAQLAKAVSEKDYLADNYDFGLQFLEEVTPKGEAAQKVVVTFQGGKTTTFTYDAETGLYAAEQYGKTYIDANTNEQMTFRNVMVLYTDQSFSHDGEYSRSYYELEGEGEGYLAINGKMEKITWARADLNSPFTYTYADGTDVILGVGKTYVAIAGDSSTPVSFQ